jgi:hypothetical protein
VAQVGLHVLDRGAALQGDGDVGVRVHAVGHALQPGHLRDAQALRQQRDDGAGAAAVQPRRRTSAVVHGGEDGAVVGEAVPAGRGDGGDLVELAVQRREVPGGPRDGWTQRGQRGGGTAYLFGQPFVLTAGDLGGRADPVGGWARRPQVGIGVEQPVPGPAQLAEDHLEHRRLPAAELRESDHDDPHSPACARPPINPSTHRLGSG